MKKFKRHLIFALCFATIVTLCYGFFMYGCQPSAATGRVLGYIHILPFEATMLVFSLFHVGGIWAYWPLVFAQWFLTGVVIALLFFRLRHDDAA